MTPEIGTHAGFWGMNPWLLAGFMIFLTIGMVNAVAIANDEFTWRGLIEYKSFIIGDLLLVPGYIGLAAYVFQHSARLGAHAIILRPEWQLLFIVISVIYVKKFETPSVEDPLHEQSHLVHFVIASWVCFLMVNAAVSLIWLIGSGHNVPVAAMIIVLACGFGHIILGLVVDSGPNKEREQRVETWKDLVKFQFLRDPKVLKSLRLYQLAHYWEQVQAPSDSN